jgi:hypothetical protein
MTQEELRAKLYDLLWWSHYGHLDFQTALEQAQRQIAYEQRKSVTKELQP